MFRTSENTGNGELPDPDPNPDPWELVEKRVAELWLLMAAIKWLLIAAVILFALGVVFQTIEDVSDVAKAIAHAF